MTLKTKFILPTLILIIVGMSITTWLTYQRSTASIAKVTVEKSSNAVTALLATVDLWVDGVQNEVITLSETDELVMALSQSDDEAAHKSRAVTLLQAAVSRMPTLDSLLFINAQGVVAGSTNPKLLGTNLSAREYFQKAMAGQNYISNPLFSSDGGRPVFVIAAPIKKGNTVIGVLSTGVKISHFTEQFVSPLNSKAGFAFILAPDGLTLAHPDAKLVGKLNVFKEMDYGAKVAAQDRGSLDTMSLGVEKLILFEKSKRTGWTIGMAVDKDAAFADARQLGLLILSLSAGVSVVLAVGIWVILTLNVLRPVGVLVAASHRIADGDLDTPLDAKRNDEIGSLQRAMRAMVANLKAKIGEAEEKSRLAAEESEKANRAMAEAEQARQLAERAREDGMLQAAGQLEGIVEAVTAASQSISDQIEHSSQGSREQSNRVDVTATAMEEMSATVIEVAQNASKAAETAEVAKRKAGEGSTIVAQVIRSIGEVQAKAMDLKTDMTRLGQQAQGIGQIMNVISDIADQTNLLALNAAIEAARAGEAGRGFAVVADEVRKLAEKTMVATKEVGDAITGIQQGTQQSIGSVEQAVRRIDDATGLAGQSGQALDTIVALVDQTTDQVRSIATASEQQSATTEEINRSVTDISRISAETASALGQSADALAGLADQTRELRRLIDAMQTGQGGPGPAALPGRTR